MDQAWYAVHTEPTAEDMGRAGVPVLGTANETGVALAPQRCLSGSQRRLVGASGGMARDVRARPSPAGFPAGFLSDAGATQGLGRGEG